MHRHSERMRGNTIGMAYELVLLSIENEGSIVQWHFRNGDALDVHVLAIQLFCCILLTRCSHIAQMRLKIHVLVKCLSGCEGTWSKRIYFDICTLTGNRPTFNFTRRHGEKWKVLISLGTDTVLGVCVCGVRSITTTAAMWSAYPRWADVHLHRSHIWWELSNSEDWTIQRSAHWAPIENEERTQRLHMPLMRVSTTSARINSNATRCWTLPLGSAMCNVHDMQSNSRGRQVHEMIHTRNTIHNEKLCASRS